MRSRLIKGVAAALVLLVAMTGSYGLWIVYENTLTPAALDQGLRGRGGVEGRERG